ncbi:MULTISPECIES: YpjP family protein [unclassified Virgibacillus]|uniref:YpjP family protein n=1 Tax=unclassified Virgibacillus TaxID=2620237 RepID=UPI0024DE1393|nr:YpjP family protein [Virgibacillus sp. LDC-1]
MKLWIRKIFVAFVAIVTLGMYVPPAVLNTNADDNKDAFASKSNFNETASPVKLVHEEQEKSQLSAVLTDTDYHIIELTEKAREQAVAKLGPKIANQVEDEFTTLILPAIENVLTTVLTENEAAAPYFAISEQPAKGHGEKIFHVYDVRNEKDIARFHVRRDNRPQEGYWFNFHYHLSKDNFETHHEIGEIYWDKNIPPNWMT